MARISPKNFTPIHAHESSRVENKRNVFLPFARSPLVFSIERVFITAFSKIALSQRSRAHPVTPTSLPAWIWDTVDRKKLNGHIIFWKEDTRDFGRGEHVRREWNETSACSAVYDIVFQNYARDNGVRTDDNCLEYNRANNAIETTKLFGLKATLLYKFKLYVYKYIYIIIIFSLKTCDFCNDKYLSHQI